MLELISNHALSPADFIGLNPKSGVPCLATEEQDPDYINKLSSSTRLLETWKKGRKHLNTFWKLRFNEYALSLRERAQNHLKSAKVQSGIQPSKGDVVLLKDSSLRGTWKLGIIDKLLPSKDHEVRAAAVRTASGKMLHPCVL